MLMTDQERGVPRQTPTLVVVGGASGIGRAVLTRFAADGWHVVAADLHAENGAALVAELSGDGASVDFVETDASDESAVAAAVGRAVRASGRLDCMVNCAGVGGAFGPLVEIDVRDWDRTFAVLCRGVFLGVKHAARVMLGQAGGGSIVNIASIAGLGGGAGPQAYSAAKAAVVNLGFTAAAELGPHRIRVNTVCPGFIPTPMTRPADGDARQALHDVQPWPEFGTVQDVAAVVRFLGSEESRFITGETIVVDGGVRATGTRLPPVLRGGDPAARGLTGFSNGSTGQKSVVHEIPADSPARVGSAAIDPGGTAAGTQERKPEQ